jgi:PAS domain S-box-containing protein
MMVLFNGELEKTPFKEYALLGKDGSKIPCEASASLLRDGTGNVVGLISVERDLRERKKTESNLQESESLLRQAEKLAGIGSWQWNLRTNTFVMSEGMSLLYGTEGKEFAHLKDIVETLIHPDDREEVYRAAEGMVVEGFGETLIYRVIRPDGEVRWINATIPEVRRFGEDGKPEIVFGAVQDVTEHKQAEQQLREREERWKLFSESATDVFTIWDSKLNLIDNSERSIQTFYPPGTRIDDLMGKNMLEFMPDEEKTGRYRDYLNVIKTGKPYFADDVVPHHKFGDKQFSIKAFKVGEGLGTIVTDITEHKRAERQLQESEERLRAFMDSSTDVYTIWDSQLRLVDVSDKGVKAFLPGKTREEQIGKHISEIVPEVMETGRYEEFLNVIETGKPFQVEEAIIHPRFALRNISINAFKVQDGMGQVVRDVTQRVQAEQKLKENEERLRFFMESATDVFNIWDSNLNLVYTAEKGLKEFFPPGTKKEDILGKNLSEIVPDIKKTGRYDEYLKVIETGKPFTAEDIVPDARFGDRHISIKAFKSGSDMGQVVTDITRQRQAEEQLQNYAERLRAMTKQLSELEEYERRYIAGELHDNVGQNLTVLGINFSRAKVLLNDGKIEEVQSILDDSQMLVEQTTEAIRNIMANLRPPVLEDYGLLAALRWHGDRFASRTEIAITVQGEEPDPRLGIDAEIVLFRIAQEALINIAKHAKAKKVTVKYNAWDGKIYLVITDDGIGFNIAAMSESVQHSGWGMVMMSERAQSIGGLLDIKSRPGGGTQIVVEVLR